MANPSIKFCGLTRHEDVETALSLGAALLGFIVECNSPRRLTVAEAAFLSHPAQGLAKRVAVTVNPDDELVAAIQNTMKPDFIQLHGDESPGRLQDIKNQHGVGLIKALSVSSNEDLDRAHDYAEAADYLLLDAKPAKGAAQRGGHGVSFDWSLMQGFQSQTPLIIAGGLSHETIALAQKMTNAHIFDVSSGIEATPGIKDAALMAKFMKAAQKE